jgi:hypothetical protein
VAFSKSRPENLIPASSVSRTYVCLSHAKYELISQGIPHWRSADPPFPPPTTAKNGNQALQLEPPIGPTQLLRWNTEWWYSGRLDMQPAMRNLLPVYFDIRTVMKHLNGFRRVSYKFLQMTVCSLSQCNITYGRQLGRMWFQRHSK